MSSISSDSKPVHTNLLEMAALALVAFIVIAVGWKIVGENLLAQQAVVWVANVAMLLTIWIALRRRRQTWSHLGLRGPGAGHSWLLAFAQSIGVFLAALAGYIVGSIVATMIFGEQVKADMSGYQYLQGNLGMLLLALAAVFIVSSFGEEVIYRGFLMTRVAEMFGDGKSAWRAAVIVSAVVFGLIHFGWGLYGIVQTAFMGLALAISYLLVGRNLWVLVIAHAYLDTILLVQLYLTPPAGGPA